MVPRRFAVAFLCASLPALAHAGAWLQPKGQGIFIANATYYGTSKYFDTEGELRKQPRFSKYELQPYVEYGLFEQVTIGGTAYAQTVSQSGTRNYGIADPEIFARATLWRSDTQRISVQPFMKFGSRFTEDKSPRGGSKTHDYGMAVMYGRSVNILSNRDYIDSSVAYRARDRGLSDQVQMDTSIGISVTDDIQLIPSLHGIASSNPTDAAVYSENGELDYGVLKAEVTGIYHLNDRQWLQAGFFKHVAGIQTGDGYGMSVGFAQRF